MNIFVYVYSNIFKYPNIRPTLTWFNISMLGFDEVGLW